MSPPADRLSITVLARIFSYLVYPIDDTNNDIHNVIHVSTKWKNAIIYTELTDRFLVSLFRRIYSICPLRPVCLAERIADQIKANAFASKLNNMRLDIIKAFGPVMFIENFCYMWQKQTDIRDMMFNLIDAKVGLIKTLIESGSWNFEYDERQFIRIFRRSRSLGIQYLRRTLKKCDVNNLSIYVTRRFDDIISVDGELSDSLHSNFSENGLDFHFLKNRIPGSVYYEDDFYFWMSDELVPANTRDFKSIQQKYHWMPAELFIFDNTCDFKSSLRKIIKYIISVQTIIPWDHTECIFVR